MDQNERLSLLLERFRSDADRPLRGSAGLTPRDELRALMNVRPPRPMDAATLRVQDAYLRQRAQDVGIVRTEELPLLREAFGVPGQLGEHGCLWQGDITRLAADAIVNAANSAMLGCFAPLHTCIDNCIHTYAGVQLRAECARQMSLLRERYGASYEQPTAVPMLTEGYNLPAEYVVHIVGPIVEGQLLPEHERLLAECYRRTLDICRERGLRTVGFCGISTGVFHFPPERAAPIAIRTVAAWLTAHPNALDRVIFTVYSDRSREIYERVLQTYGDR